MNEHPPTPPSDEPAATPAWQSSPGWWFRRVGLPALVLIAIAGAIVWLQRPEEDSARRVATEDVPLEADTGAPQEGAAAPDFSLSTLDGQTVKLSDYQGKVVLLNFWATWCGPCREEMPLFQQAVEQHEGDGLVVLAVNVEEGAGQVRSFIERIGVHYTVLMDGKGTVARRYRVRSYPTTFFIGRDGKVEGRRVGEYTRQILFGRLSQLLEP